MDPCLPMDSKREAGQLWEHSDPMEREDVPMVPRQPLLPMEALA